MGVLIDIEDGGEVQRDFINIRVVRVAHVDQLSGSTPDAMLWDAINTAGIPALGDPHPSIPQVTVVNHLAVPVRGCDRARVEIEYGIPRIDPPPVSGDGADTKSARFFSQPVQTSVLFRGTPSEEEIEVDPPAKVAATRKAQSKIVTINESRGVLVFTRTETVWPGARMRQFQNTTNSVALATGTYPIGTLYCNVIQADTRDQAATYLVRYEFLYNAGGFNIEVRWESTGIDLTASDYAGTPNSRKIITPHGAEDFNALGLDFSD